MIEDFIAKYSGKRIGDGECGSLVRQYAIEVQGIAPISYPSAKDYWFNPVPGYVKVSDPQDGDWAIYNSHGAYLDGHMALYYQGEVFEQNADPDGSPAHLFKRANTYLLGYLRKEGNTVEPLNAGDLVNIHNADWSMGWPGHPINANDIAEWVNGTDRPAGETPKGRYIELMKDVAKYIEANSGSGTVLKPGNYKVE